MSHSVIASVFTVVKLIFSENGGQHTLTSAEQKNYIDFFQTAHYSRIDNLYVYTVRVPNEGGLGGQDLSNFLKLHFVMDFFPKICF